ncbi:MAG: hypothetical protein U0166_05895 [Acidobacteriota bacterium]
MGTAAALLFAIVSEAAYVTLLAAGDLRAHPVALLSALAMAIAAYLAIVPVLLRAAPAAAPRRILVGAALLARTTLLPATPSLSDDVYRYLWDGRMLREGINPYRYAPGDEALERFRDPAWQRINYPELPTIYPPAAQILFAAASPFGLPGLKLAMAAGEGLLVLGIRALLRERGLPEHLVLVYALHPLPIVEVFHSGHLEAVPVAGLCWALVFASRGRPGTSGAFWGAAIVAKFFPLCLVPQALRTLRVRGGLAIAAVVASLYAPFLGAGRNVFRSLWEYGTRWRWYDSIFGLILWTTGKLHLGEAAQAVVARLDAATYGTAIREPVRALYAIAYDGFVARAIDGLAFAAVLAIVFRRRLALHDAALAAGAAFVLLTPSLHPWYMLWVLPWLCLRFSWGLAVLGALVPLSYSTFLAGPAIAGHWSEPFLLKVATFATTAVLLLFDARRWRR